MNLTLSRVCKFRIKNVWFIIFSILFEDDNYLAFVFSLFGLRNASKAAFFEQWKYFLSLRTLIRFATSFCWWKEAKTKKKKSFRNNERKIEGSRKGGALFPNQKIAQCKYILCCCDFLSEIRSIKNAHLQIDTL